MTVKPVTKKKKDSSPGKGEPQAVPGGKPATGASPKNKVASKAANARPKKADVATVDAGPERHHATLTAPFSETVCSECTVGLLKKYINPSLRKQRELDPGNQQFHLKDDEEIEFIRDKPLSLQLIGLRRERSLSNKFDDLLVVLYDPALLKEPEEGDGAEEKQADGKKAAKKILLEGTGLRQENLESTQAFVDRILADKEAPPPKNWPLPGTDVSCLQCKHWRVVVFPLTTEPGYDLQAPTRKDEQGQKIPNFDDLTLLPQEVGCVAPGIYNNRYRVGLHKGSSKPHTSFAALQLTEEPIPARRRYPIGLYLKNAEIAFSQKNKADDALLKEFMRNDAKAYKETRDAILKELNEMPRKTPAEKSSFEAAVNARLVVAYAPKILELRKNAAKGVLNNLKSRISKSERYIRLENAGGAETQNFDKDGNRVASLEVVDDESSSIHLGIQVVFTPQELPSPPAVVSSTGAPSISSPAPVAPPPRTLGLTKDDILVTFGTAKGTHIHRSVDIESGSWKATREVNNWSEGCQVFRSPSDFRDFMRLAMLAKRAHCPNRTSRCCAPLTLKDVEDGIGANMLKYLNGLPDDFAKHATTALETVFPSLLPEKEVLETVVAPRTATSAKNATASSAKATTVDSIAKGVVPEPAGSGTPPSALDPAAVDLALKAQKRQEAASALFARSDAYKGFGGLLKEVYEECFPKKSYYTEKNYQGVEEYARARVVSGLDEESTKNEIEDVVKQVVKEVAGKMSAFKEEWLKSTYSRALEGRYKDFLVDGLESCDFGGCCYRFDYMLAEVPRVGMEEFVSKLGARDWSSLFPQDAPPPAPAPAKSARPKVKPAEGVNPKTKPLANK